VVECLQLGRKLTTGEKVNERLLPIFRNQNLPFGKPQLTNRTPLQLFWLQQTVQMYHHKPHFGIVDGFLGRGAPGVFGGFIVGENADDLQIFGIGEVERLRVFDPAAEDEMEFAHARFP
jgi:hypothetical protein